MTDPVTARPGRRRDRRGRGIRGPLAWPPVPVMVTRSEAFDELVVDSAARLQKFLDRRRKVVEFGVEDVPPSDPAPWEDGMAPLARLFPAQGRLPNRIVVYRRPIEARADYSRDLPLLVHEVLVQQVAALLEVDVSEIEPGLEE